MEFKNLKIDHTQSSLGDAFGVKVENLTGAIERVLVKNNSKKKLSEICESFLKEQTEEEIAFFACSYMLEKIESVIDEKQSI